MIIQLLKDNNISKKQINNFIDKLTANKDYGDCYFQYSTAESYFLENNIIKDASFNIISGVGVRSIIDDKTGFSYSDNLDIKSINQAIDFAKTIPGNTADKKILCQHNEKVNKYYNNKSPVNSISNEEKINILHQINKIARENRYVKEVQASISGSYDEILIASSEGTYAYDYRPMVRISINIIAEKDGKIESANGGGGGRYDYSYFINNDLYKKYTQDAVEQAVTNLSAKVPPFGVMPVVLGSGWPGVLLHEAIGHGLEGDFNRKKTSVFTNKINKKIASSKCSVVDNGTLTGKRGSLNIDDEGTPTQNTILIKDGILKNYMFDKLNAKLMNTSSTGNARRESYAHLPMPRMTNTYMVAGKDNPEDMIKSIKKGIYALNFAGGQVDITSGDFVFSASKAYLIENGKIKHPVKGMTLTGKGSDVLEQISMVGDDLELDAGVGVCGKNGQNVPVSVGQPSLKIDKIIVGGSK